LENICKHGHFIENLDQPDSMRLGTTPSIGNEGRKRRTKYVIILYKRLAGKDFQKYGTFGIN